MSTAIETIHDWPCPCDACGPIPKHDFSADEYRQRQIWKLMMIVVGQREQAELKDNGWHQVFCLDCDQSSEPFQGKLESFGEQLYDTGWTVVSLDNFTVSCPACATSEIELTERDQWEDQAVYLARGK